MSVKKEAVTTGLSQLTYAMSKVALGKPMSRAKLTDKLTLASLEPVIYRWNGVKDFNTRGFYWMQNRIEDAGFRSLPFYMFDLTAVNNTSTSLGVPTPYFAAPMMQLGMNVLTGAMSFKSQPGYAGDGTTLVYNYNIEKSPTAPTAAGSTSAQLAPLTKSMLSWASIQMNLWGCTAKATKFAVQLVRISDRDLVPQHADTGVATSPFTYAQEFATVSANYKTVQKRNDFYQNLVKTWTFNPISTTGGLHQKSYKVLKTHEFTIEPNLTIDGDANANVKVFKMFATLNKMCNYVDSANALTSDAQLITNPTYAINTGVQVTNQLKPTSRVYLVIRATNYGNDTLGDTPAETPSFDLSIKVKHTISQ